MANQIDLHIHTSASDGSDSIPELLEKLLRAGIHTFAVTDHDTIDGTLQMDKLVPKGLRYLRGIEFSCISPQGKCHILGYGYDPEDARFRAALEEGRALRLEKLGRRVAFLESRFGIPFTAEEMRWLHSQKSPGKPHLGQILVARGLADNIDMAIKKYVNPFKGGNDRISADMAIKAILHAGGIPIWAHPLGGEGERRLTGEAFSAQLRELMASGIRGLEAYYSRYDREDISFLLREAEAHHLLVSGGSDYHGKNKADLELGQLSSHNAEIDPAQLTLLHVV